MPFTTEQHQLEAVFATFGELQYALVVKDKDTGRGRGTAFVRFANKHDADACLERATDATLVRPLAKCHGCIVTVTPPRPFGSRPLK